MQLVERSEDRSFARFYHKRQVLTRPNTLPYLFRKLRVHRGITKSQLSAKIAVSERYVDEVENGLRFPSLRYCVKCGELFGANANWVKVKWAREAVERYIDRLHKRLRLDSWGGGR